MSVLREPDFARARREAEKVLADNYIRFAPVDVESLVKNYLGDIEYQRFKPPYDQVSGYIDFKSRSIVINDDDSKHRKRFTLAHELGHWVMHKDELEDEPSRGILLRKPIGGESDPYEQEANYFAATLLVPLEILETERIGKNFIELAKLFEVSQDVMGYRLDDLGRELQESPDRARV